MLRDGGSIPPASSQLTSCIYYRLRHSKTVSPMSPTIKRLIVGAYFGLTEQIIVDAAVELRVLGVEREAVQTTVVVVDRVGGVAHGQLRHLAADLAHVSPRAVVVAQPMPPQQRPSLARFRVGISTSTFASIA
jgi:hypothetical protein